MPRVAVIIGPLIAIVLIAGIAVVVLRGPLGGPDQVAGPVEPTATEPGADPTKGPLAEPTETVEPLPTTEPTVQITTEPPATVEPTPTDAVAADGDTVDDPAAEPTDEPTTEPTDEPTTEPTTEPTAEPTTEPTDDGREVAAGDTTDARPTGGLPDTGAGVGIGLLALLAGVALQRRR